MLKRFITILLLFPLLALADTFVEGKDYEVIKDSAEKGKPAVTEFFSYACPWCYRIEPGLQTWRKQHSDLDFSRIPVVFNKDWAFYAKAYYMANLLKLHAKIDPLLFKAIQTDKKNLLSNQAMIDFFVEQGVDKETADSGFTNSTMISMKVSEGNALMARFHINAVPAFVVNTRYKTDLQMAKSEERLYKILDYLLTR